jgi:hypothetical protein
MVFYVRFCVLFIVGRSWTWCRFGYSLPSLDRFKSFSLGSLCQHTHVTPRLKSITIRVLEEKAIGRMIGLKGELLQEIEKWARLCSQQWPQGIRL